MKRNPAALADGEFDVLIVGAGIYGSTLAWSASRRGLRTALIDAGDFGGAASANSLKIIHGGLRYLQHGNLYRMRESIRARRRFLQLAPETARPLACLISTRGSGTRSRWMMAGALQANAAISWDRNAGVRADRRLPAGGIISRDEFLSLTRMAHADGITGGARWYDAIAENTDRLNLAFVVSSEASGAVPVNYMRAVQLLPNGAEVEDVLTGDRLTVRAAQVVCAAGPGNEKLWAAGPRTRWVKASNLILKKQLVKDFAVAIEGTSEFRDSHALVKRGRRNFFVVPWRGGTMIGTSYAPFDPAKDAAVLMRREIENFVREINDTRSFGVISPDDICRIHVGVLPAAGGEAEPAKETVVAQNEHGAIFLRGVKYTTAIETADQLADLLQQKLGRRVARAADIALPWSPPPDRVEVAVEDEMAVKLSDYIFRRSTLGDFGLPDRDALNRCAGTMAERLHWDARRREDEIAEVVGSYTMPAS